MRIYIFRKKNMLGDENLVRKNKSTCDIECLDECDIDDEGFIEGDLDLGKVVSSFSFGIDGAAKNNSSLIQSPANEILTAENQTYSSSPRGLTPPINGENFTVKRSYTMRPSTVRKLNALKTEHPDVNVLYNTIVDMAITHYYNYIFKDGGTSTAKNTTS